MLGLLFYRVEYEFCVRAFDKIVCLDAFEKIIHASRGFESSE